MFTVNGILGFGDKLYIPRTGAWHADVRVDTPDELAGDVTIDIDEGKLALVGYVATGGNWQDTGFVRIVGGHGGLSKTVKPRHYSSTSVRVVLADALASVGEKLSTTSDAATVGRSLHWWTTTKLAAGALIAEVLRRAAPAANWRVLPDGTVWVGVETWPDSGFTDDDHQVLSESPEGATARVGTESPVMLPGTTLNGRKISYVEHSLGEETRSEIHFETDDASTSDRLKRALGAAVRGTTAAVDYHAAYFATVISQSGKRIDVKPEDDRLPSMGNVPLLCGVPGWTLTLKAGGRVLIGWSGGNPTRPWAMAFDGDASAAKLGINAAQLVVGTEAAAFPALLSSPYRTAEDAFLDALAAGVQAALSALTLTPAAATLTAAQTAWHGLAPTFLSTQVKNS